MGSLYRKVWLKPTLRKAARAVLENARTSTSEASRQEAEEFVLRFEQGITEIQRELKGGEFKFAPARGVAAKKPGKTTRRPIVIAPIKSRIVQRAILNVISELPAIKAIQKKELNLGGVKDGGVAKAIKRAYEGGVQFQYYVRTDLKNFFTAVSKEQLVRLVTEHTDDAQFDELLKRATEVELSNLAELREHGHLFPLGELGVAQGSCLSPLLCNLLLHELDESLNQGGSKSVRYIDDVIIFAPNRSQALKLFQQFKSGLKKLGLDAYDPPTSGVAGASSKAAAGETKSGFSFLGCDVSHVAISPGKKARQSLLGKIDELTSAALSSQRHLKIGTSEPLSMALDPTRLNALWRIANTIRAWGAAFSFCTDRRIFRALDQDVAARMEDFKRHWSGKMKSLSLIERSRLMGIHLLDDTDFDLAFVEMVSMRAGTLATKGAPVVP
ncbi:reverse transcriptase domain-containing protein [Caballeronia sp. NCTM5]|uniref:reverse transcriptase domain-containing protein n=1 Tax=Caballeronia sp. NCTM5 TaxID=2921755 RepID=UPI002028BEC9|nr:reverse transcriptase domain-containing protein [Caballeronia sp. NCTM5]